ncbi:MAG: PEP-CTERM sorting domain-containing protein [Acidobacteriota bacterium]|nr:PEP-CTERM sorting domain-containing protein [Acidobacteriota bacterium]
MKNVLMTLIFLFVTLTTSAGYGATTVFFDNFEDPDNVLVPVIGTSAGSNSNSIIPIGSNHVLQSTDNWTSDGISIGNIPIYAPVQSITAYDFTILAPLNNTSLVGENAFLQELVLNNGTGDNLFLYWGADNQLRLLTSVNGRSGALLDLSYGWEYGQNNHVEWIVDGVTDTFSLTVNGTKLQDSVLFGDPIDKLSILYYGSNFPTTGIQQMDNVTIRDLAAVPEPTTLLLLGAGLVGIISLKRIRTNS